MNVFKYTFFGKLFLVYPVVELDIQSFFFLSVGHMLTKLVRWPHFCFLIKNV